jgi:GTP-binding protein
MIGAECTFLAGVTDSNDIPSFDLSEVAFWGKSNVGKSSLINAVLGRKLLARVSKTPGRTKQLNFFAIDKKIIFVDLPGYGYAKVSKQEIRSWKTLIRNYFATRSRLRRVFLLIDVRHKLRDHDIESMDLLDELAISYQIIFTKCDKKERDIASWDQVFADLCKKHSALYPEFLMTSSESKHGIEELRANIISLF